MDKEAPAETERASATGARRGSPAPAPGTPFAPSKPAHDAVPAPSSGSTGPSGGADAPTTAIFSPSAGQRNRAGGRALPDGDTHSLGQPGTMPGVTPD